MFVLDCSVTMPWLLKNDPSGYADTVARHLAQEEALVPSLWVVEVNNVLVSSERRRQLTVMESTRFKRHLNLLPIKIDSAPLQMTEDKILSLCREHSLSAYDAMYLELALRNSIALATLDKALKKAANAISIPLL